MFKILLGGILACAIQSPAWADDPLPSVSDIMTKVNGKKTGLNQKVTNGLKAAKPNWDELGKQTKEYKTLIDALAKNDPPQGDKASWTKLTKEYVENVKKVGDAVEKKDKDAADKAMTAIGKSCGACHKEHKPS
jgi:cytochrome c556